MSNRNQGLDPVVAWCPAGGISIVLRPTLNTIRISKRDPTTSGLSRHQLIYSVTPIGVGFHCRSTQPTYLIVIQCSIIKLIRYFILLTYYRIASIMDFHNLPPISQKNSATKPRGLRHLKKEKDTRIRYSDEHTIR